MRNSIVKQKKRNRKKNNFVFASLTASLSAPYIVNDLWKEALLTRKNGDDDADESPSRPITFFLQSLPRGYTSTHISHLVSISQRLLHHPHSVSIWRFTYQNLNVTMYLWETSCSSVWNWHNLKLCATFELQLIQETTFDIQQLAPEHHWKTSMAPQNLALRPS